MAEVQVAIVGAGLSGLCLALALCQRGISCEIFETRHKPLDIGGAIMLSPNALRILDRLNVYQHLQSYGYHFDNLYFRTEDDKDLDVFEFGSKKDYGYTGMRVYRFELINILLESLRSFGIQPNYGKRFDRVTAEETSGVTWLFSDGSQGKAQILVGADGIHSHVRLHLFPEATPTFLHAIAITTAIETKHLDISGYSLPITIMNKKHGAFVIAPQRSDGSELLIGRQCAVEEDLGRQGWDKLVSDTSRCSALLGKGAEDFPSIVNHALSLVSHDKINVWPFYRIPELEKWTSQSGRIIILGDAAHAIPPTSGQGVNQAFEDVYTFSEIILRLFKAKLENLQEVLHKWQIRRQERINLVLDLNAKLNKRRMPSENGEDITMEPFDLNWLYGEDPDHMVKDILDV